MSDILGKTTDLIQKILQTSQSTPEDINNIPLDIPNLGSDSEISQIDADSKPPVEVPQMVVSSPQPGEGQGPQDRGQEDTLLEALKSALKPGIDVVPGGNPSASLAMFKQPDLENFLKLYLTEKGISLRLGNPQSKRLAVFTPLTQQDEGASQPKRVKQEDIRQQILKNLGSPVDQRTLQAGHTPIQSRPAHRTALAGHTPTQTRPAKENLAVPQHLKLAGGTPTLTSMQDRARMARDIREALSPSPSPSKHEAHLDELDFDTALMSHPGFLKPVTWATVLEKNPTLNRPTNLTSTAPPSRFWTFSCCGRTNGEAGCTNASDHLSPPKRETQFFSFVSTPNLL